MTLGILFFCTFLTADYPSYGIHELSQPASIFPVLEKLWVAVLCTQLFCICIIRDLERVVGL